MLDIKITDKNGVKRVDLIGELNVKNVADFEEHFNEFDGKKIILNAEELSYISSAGLRSLIILIKELKNTGGELVLCALAGVAKNIIEISGFENLFKVFKTVPEAEKYFSK